MFEIRRSRDISLFKTQASSHPRAARQWRKSKWPFP